jgi:GT2 family glycosyltransferase
MNDQHKIIDFSIIIPLTVINDYIRETCQELRKLDNQNFELIIIANEKTPDLEELLFSFQGQVISAGDVSPAIKRDLGVKASQGKYLAFIDDDAYPKKDWLNLAQEQLTQENVSAVGGPQVTPPNNSFWQKVSGAMFLSPLSGAGLKRYCPRGQVCEIDDWPTVNLIVKKEDFLACGGFDNAYWPGEDTKLCLDIIKKLKKKILYVPEMIVYHHRREGLKKHLKQVGGYGLHRGYFAKIFPETSQKLMYFIPSLWVIFLILGTFSYLLGPVFWKLYLAGIMAYFLAIIFSTSIVWGRTKSLLISLASVPYLVLFHLWYGIRFIQGFIFTKELKSKLGR